MSKTTKNELGLIPSIILLLGILMWIPGLIIYIYANSNSFDEHKDKNLYNSIGQGLFYSGIGIMILINIIYAPWKDIREDLFGKLI